MQEYIVRYSAKQNTTEAWSIQRIPFEPKGWLIDLRNDIRKEMRRLTSHPHQILHAIYGSQSNGFCDTENILLYNIGNSHFSSLTTSGIRFERCFSYPVPPHTLAATNLHYHLYTMEGTNESFSYWQAGRILAEWENVKVPKLTSTAKATDIWYCMNSSNLKTLYSPESIPQRFGLTITLMVPIMDKVNVANLTKPLIDGIVSSFHVHTGENTESLSQRLGSHLSKKASIVTELLCHSDRAILGARQVVRPYRSGIKWDPADDHCLATEIFAQAYPDKDWLISGKLFEITYKGA
jgi:hypothetical protein